MSKIKIHQALDEVEQHGRDAFMCATCDNVKIDGEKHCRSCKDYWEDVANGAYDRFEDMFD